MYRRRASAGKPVPSFSPMSLVIGCWLACQPKPAFLARPVICAAPAWRRLERETGIEPATNSLEGCDSTTELLPPCFLGPGGCAPAGPPTRSLAGPLVPRSVRARPRLRAAGSSRILSLALAQTTSRSAFESSLVCPAETSAASAQRRRNGEGRIRTFEAARATDLQSAAFDRFATSPTCLCVGMPASDNICMLECALSTMPCSPSGPMELAEGFEPTTC